MFRNDSMLVFFFFSAMGCSDDPFISQCSCVHPTPSLKWWHPAQCWPLNFVGPSFVHVILGFEAWRGEIDTRKTIECVCTHTHTQAIDSFRMHLQRVNRVTSTASSSVLKLSTLLTCATYWNICMILDVLCQHPLLILKSWHLFALPVAMKVQKRWFSGKVKQGFVHDVWRTYRHRVTSLKHLFRVCTRYFCVFFFHWSVNLFHYCITNAQPFRWFVIKVGCMTTLADCSFWPQWRRQKGGSLCERRSRGIPDRITGGGVPAPPVGPSQLLCCNQIPIPLSSRLPALFEVISSAGKKSQRAIKKE